MGCMLFVIGAALVVVGIFAKQARAALIVVGALCLVGGAISIGVAAGLGMGGASTVSARGTRVDSKGMVTVVMSSGSSLWYFSTLDSQGQPSNRYLLPKNAGNYTTANKGDGSLLPVPNVPVFASFRVLLDGASAEIDTWETLAPNAAQQRSAVTGTSRIAAIFRVSFVGDTCADGSNDKYNCQPCATVAELTERFCGKTQSVGDFYRLVSNGQLNFDTCNVYEATVPPSTPYGQLMSVISQQIGSKTAHNYIVMLPPGYKSAPLDGGAAGLGDMFGRMSWNRNCDFRVYGHELG